MLNLSSEPEENHKIYFQDETQRASDVPAVVAYSSFS
jgi:hypothetical protein